MFTDEEKLNLRKFVQEIILKPRSLESQNVLRSETFIWCDDWETVEICKCLFNGEPVYLEDPLPNRLKNNPVFPGKQEIIIKANNIIKEFETVENIIKHLRSKRSGT